MKNKKVLLISGSNRNGNTNYILNQIANSLENAELILLNKCNIQYCRGCLACHNIPNCVIQDDMKELINKIIDTDVIVFGVPNYFDNVTDLFKNFMDRLHPLYKTEIIKDKKVVCIYIGGGDAEGTLADMQKAVEGLNKYLKLNLVKEYSYQALNLNDVKTQEEKINSMIEEIKEIK